MSLVFSLSLVVGMLVQAPGRGFKERMRAWVEGA